MGDCRQVLYGVISSGEGGIRTPKPVRAPVFETGALPFCHLSECRLPGCSRKLLKRPVGAAEEGAPRGLLLSNFRDGRGGIDSPATRVRRARDQRSLGWLPPAARDSPSSLPLVARFEPTRGRRFRPASWKLLNGRGGIRTHEAGLLPTRSPGVRLSPLGHPSGSLRGEAGGREAEGVGFEPTRLFRVNALAGRRLKPLGHPSAGSCCPDWPARTRTWNLLVQSQTCCQFHHGPTSQ